MIDLYLLKGELRRDEGERLAPYKDSVGKWTIGVGRNFEDVPFSTEELQYILVHGFDTAASHMCLGNDIKRTLKDLDEHLPWWRDLSDNRQRVLANMCFNMGIGSDSRGLLSFKNTLRAVKEGRYQDAARGMLASKWASQVGERARRLAKLMEEG